MILAIAATTSPTTAAATLSPGEYFGAWVLVPPLVTIGLAIWWRQVLPALAIGILIAGYMLAAHAMPGAWGDIAVGGLREAVEGQLITAIADESHVKIVVFTLFIGGMVGVIAANGGTAAVVRGIGQWASTRARGQISTWFAGLVVFFDDYANAMIVGPSMRPICDRLHISRAKLAYLVDSTAAPVASIALIGTWVGTEIDYIAIGLDGLAQQPSFLEGVTPYGAFLASIPYRFYPILALVMVFLVGWLGRDFGPMRRAEQKAATAIDPEQTERTTIPVGRARYALVPVGVLVLLTVALLFVTGWPAGGLASIKVPPETPRWVGVLANILYNCDSYNALLYGSLSAMVVAGVISLATGALKLAGTVAAATDTMARMLPTIAVLVLAWSLSGAMQALELGAVARELLVAARFDAMWLPSMVFLAAAIVSFATGTSWGTMGILCPAAVTIAAGLLDGQPADTALPIFYASVGAVLAGAVFGDHCSPISDTTVLSSLATECSLESHVWTQMPYALVVGVVSMVCGDVLCRLLELSAWVGLAVGVVLLFVLLLAVGRTPQSQASAVRPA